ncbi:MAG: toll/interleukin-1 receptor domain-containing protein [Pseudomonadota bacterium]
MSYCYALYPFYKRPTYVIPHSWLKVPTLGELFNRNRELSQLISDLEPFDDHGEAIEMAEVCEEKSQILNEIWSIERRNTRPMIEDVPIFLCHASEDKGFVRRVYQDLKSKGQKPWIDEAEINVGQSIVDAVDKALGNCKVFMLFLSEDSINKSWVKKEWNATLMRKLSGADILFIPALIDSVQTPALLSDLKYADFSEGYGDAIDAVIQAIQRHFISLEFDKSGSNGPT